MRIKYLINRESAKKNLKKGKKARPMSPKGPRHSLIFITVGIPLKKILVLLRYIRNKSDFLPPIGPSSHTKALEEIPRKSKKLNYSYRNFR